MALVVNDRVKETSTTTGTGTFSLAGASLGFETFVAGIGNSNTTFYSIVNEDGAFEVGIGTVTDATPDTLSRDTILSSSNSDNAVDFAAGTKDVFCTLPASRFVPGKYEGTNFTNSILIGHSTTGTLSSAQKNTGVGIEALDALTSGDQNNALGYKALTSVNSGGRNTGIGHRAGENLTTGSFNTMAGDDVSRKNVTGSYNSSYGVNALEGVTNNSHSYNSAFGAESLKAITTGDRNIGIGYQSGDNVTTGAGNVIIGSVDADSATGNRQLKISGNDGSTTTTWISGDNSGNLTFAGTATADSGKDVILGKLEGTDFTDSLLVGHNTTGTLSSAERNTGVGVASLDALTSGDGNTGLGNNTLTDLTSGFSNTALGDGAGENNTGNENTFVGAAAGNTSQAAYRNTTVGRSSGFGLTTGNNNILIGHDAGKNITTGKGNLIIGSEVNADSATGDHQLVIANYNDSSTVTWIKGASTGQLTISGAYTLPASDGSANQVLTTDGSGAVTFQTPTTGDITGVTAGDGLTGGGSSGDVTLNVGAGTGIDVAADAISVDVSDFMTNGSNNRVVTATGTDGQNAEANLTFDGSTLTVTGDISATSLDADGGITVDNITIDGTEIDLSSGDLTIDVAGDITLDAGGSDIRFDAGGSEYGKLNLSGNNLNIHSSINDADIVFKGEDGGSTITALTLDMSDAGTASFNHDVKLSDNSKALFGDDSDFEIYHSGSASIVREASSGNLILAGNDVNITNGAMNETHIDCNNNGSVDLYHNNVKKFETSADGITVTGHVEPGANDTYDLGQSDNVWRNLYTGDLHLSNEAKSEGNAVDGTKGNWTIQEGAEDLYILNNKSGKKYRFKLEEM